MAMEEFTWRPLLETPSSTKYRNLTAQFGDGYKQVAGDGINTKLQAWDLLFRSSSSVITDITEFLDRHAGALRFEWTPRGESKVVVRCSEYNTVNHTHTPTRSGVVSLTAKFEREYAA